MKRSTERVLVTHTGSLPRPDDLADMLFARESGDLVDRVALEMRVRSAVAKVVRKQAEVGVNVVNDGEMGKIGYSTYVKDRLSGFGDETTKRASLAAADVVEFPEFNQRAFMGRKAPPMKRPSCNGPIAYRDRNESRTRPRQFQGRARRRQRRRGISKRGVARRDRAVPW